jgi:hypothetical protein
MINFQKKQLSP